MTTDDNRLTGDDRARMRDAVAGMLTRWDDGYRAHHGRPAGRYRVQACDLETLQRAAAHAVGCSIFDLRDVELDEVSEMVRSLVVAREPGC